MGKRKSRQVQSKGPAPKVDTVFDCPYCSHRQTIEVKMVRKDGFGKLHCRVCTVKFQKRLGPLDKEVDVYCAWIDQAEELNKQGRKDNGLGMVGGDDSDSDGNYPFLQQAPKVLQKKVSLGEFDNSDEEYKEMPNPEKMSVGVTVTRKPSNPFSASEKIAELGLGQAAVEKMISLGSASSPFAKEKGGLG